MTDYVQQQDQNAAITAWQEQVAPLAGFAQAASDILGSIEGPLGELYHQANDAGDQGTVDRVMAVWNQSQELAKLIPPFAAALQGGAATIEELRNQRDSIADELKGLIDDIQNADGMNPLVAELAETVEENVWDYINFSGEVASYDEVYEQLYNEISEVFSVNWQLAADLVNALRGYEPELTDYRRELIVHLLKTFEAESND